MLDFRFLLGIFVICFPGVVLFLREGRYSWVRLKKMGLRLCGFLCDFSRVALFLKDVFLFQSLKHVARKKAVCETVLVFSLEKSLPGQFSGNFAIPTFSWELNAEVEGRGLFVFPCSDFYLSSQFLPILNRQLLNDLS